MLENKSFSPFSQVDDPRQQGKINHSLSKILIITFTATLAGADSWTAIIEFAKPRIDWLSAFVDMSTGIPSHDTLERVFSLIDPAQFQQSFIEWVQHIIATKEQDIPVSLPSVVAVDGKTLRRSHDKSSGKSAIHMINAWSSEANLVLGQLKTDQKSNEITAVPELLKLLDLEGRLVTTDAMSCQKQVADTCIEQGANYLLAVKGNQPTLKKEIENHLGSQKPKPYKKPLIDFFETQEKSRDRNEVRRCWVTPADKVISKLEDWRGLQSIARVESERTHKGQTSIEQRYYICSNALSAEKVLYAARNHWGVESLHWMLDVAFNEDGNRTRKGNAAENLAVMRQVTLNVLKQDKKTKLSIKNKRFRACNDVNYLSQLICSLHE